MAMPAIGTILLVFFAWSFRFGTPTHALSNQMFFLCFGGLFIGCLFSGLQATADSISREKREGTLGFLFLTDLAGYDIVLGKLVSSSLAGVYSFLGMMPVVSIIFLFGGVTWGEVIRLLAASGIALFLSLSAGLLASVLSVQEKKAKSLASGLILGCCFAGPVIGMLVLFFEGKWTTGQSVIFWTPYLLCSPIGIFTSAISPMLGAGLKPYLISSGILVGIGAVFLLLACYLAPRTWQEKGAQKGAGKWQERWRLWIFGSAEQNQSRRAAMLDLNPIHWLTNRSRWKGRLVWLTLGGAMVVLAGLGVADGREFFNPVSAVFFVWAVNAVLKLSLAGESVRWISQDRQNGVLELILTTPMKVEEVLEGQRITLQRLYRWPFIIGGFAQVIFLCLCFVYWPVSISKDSMALYGFLMLAASLAVMAADYVAIGWIGMWCALSVTPIAKARAQAAAAALIFPWVLFYIGMIAWMVLTRGSLPWSGFVLWPLWMLAMAGWSAHRARKKLMAEFRIRAMERYTELPAHPAWARAGRFVALAFSRSALKRR
jgi:hypothetical protein